MKSLWSVNHHLICPAEGGEPSLVTITDQSLSYASWQKFKKEIMSEQMKDFLDANNVLSKSQSGFRKKKKERKTH